MINRCGYLSGICQCVIHINNAKLAVHITHIPTGIQSQCQSKTLFKDNRTLAIKLLRSKLLYKDFRSTFMIHERILKD